MGHRRFVPAAYMTLLTALPGYRVRRVPRRVFDPPHDDIRLVKGAIGGGRRLTLSKIPTSRAKNAREMGHPRGFAPRSWRSERNPAAVRVSENPCRVVAV